jgi:protease I
MEKSVLIPLPRRDFDPTEVAIPAKVLREAGVRLTFATPDALVARCDERMLLGTGLGPLKPLLAADARARVAYSELESSDAFRRPLLWTAINPRDYDGLLLPGGHAPGMREYLESPVLQNVVRDFFAREKPVGAICHGVVLAARSLNANGHSVLRGRRSTALLRSQEYAAWLLTGSWLGRYYRTYPETVESEVKRNLASKAQFIAGPLPLLRDSPQDLSKGFALRDGNYVSARWPGDAHKFASEFLSVL